MIETATGGTAYNFRVTAPLLGQSPAVLGRLALSAKRLISFAFFASSGHAPHGRAEKKARAGAGLRAHCSLRSQRQLPSFVMRNSQAFELKANILYFILYLFFLIAFFVLSGKSGELFLHTSILSFFVPIFMLFFPIYYIARFIHLLTEKGGLIGDFFD